MVDVAQKRIDLILQQLEQLPTLPAVAVRVLEATASDESGAADVTKLISSDPALTTRILQLVHRADAGVRGEVTSVERAVVLMGFEAVRCAVLAISVFEAFGTSEPVPAATLTAGGLNGGFSRGQFWRHCIAVACCAELLAEETRKALGREKGIDPSEAFVCGLLHDLGKVALDVALPKSYARAVEANELLRTNIADLERSVIGLDHMVVGKRLAERWQLPHNVRDCIWLHGQAPEALPASVGNARLVNLITLADLLVRQQHIGYSGNHLFPLPAERMIEAVGINAEAVERALTELVTRIEPRAGALGLSQSSTGELYLQAVAQANRELGRISGQLATRNRKLAARAKFFDALTAFQCGLRPDAPARAVLEAIAQSAVEVLESNSAAAFSSPPGKCAAEVVMVDDQGRVFETALVEFAGLDAGPTCPLPGEGPVLRAGQGLEPILDVTSPRLGHAQRFWICLEIDGRCVGGVLWGAPAGEGQRLSSQAAELTALAGGWGLALRTAQIREEASVLAEQLAEANRNLQGAQAQVLRSRTLSGIGEMAAGAAHEMNNPLAVISGRAQLLAHELQDPRHRAAAHLIAEQCQRLSRIITELMDFARPTTAQARACDVADLLERALHQAKARSESADSPNGRIELTASDVPAVLVDAEQVVAALAEVLANAIQAGGTQPIVVHAAHDPSSARIVLTVTDQGPGMDQTTLEHAFDPFFSAKPAGRQRGMGLAKALRWIESSSGTIRLESRLGHGTRVTVLLPAAKAAPATETSVARKLA